MIASLFVAFQAAQNPNVWFDTTRSEFAIFHLKDSMGRKMDCLKLVPSSDGKKFYGVYHALSDDVFSLWLAESKDAKYWTPIRQLGSHSHQGTIAIDKSGKVLVGSEVDVPGKGNHLRVAYFRTEKDLEQNKPSSTKDIARTFSPSAEGTPSFEKIDWGRPFPSVVIGFHYWRDTIVDRQAVGHLDSHWNWTCQKRPAYDQFVEGFGVSGNIGDRDNFEVGDRFTIIEGMKTKDDWSSWNLYLVNTTKHSCLPVQVRTPKGSRSFANPSVTVVGRRLYISMFLPSQGNDPAEAGELLYAIDR